MKRIFIPILAFILLALLFPIELRSEQNGKKATLEDCIEISLSRHRPIQIARDQIELASLKVNEARRALFPFLAGEYKTSEGQTITEGYQAKSYGIQVEQPIFDGGEIQYTLRQQELGLEVARKNYEKVKNELEAKVLGTYYEFARAKTILKKWQDLLEEAKIDLKLSGKLYEAGLNTEVEFLNVKARYDLIYYHTRTVESEVSSLRLAFYQVLNIEYTELEEENILFEFSPPKEFSFSLEDCFELAKRNHPEIMIAEDIVSSTKYRKLIAQRGNLPKLSLVSSYGRAGEAYEPEELSMVDEWAVTGKLTWNFGVNAVEYSVTQDKTLSEQIVDTSYKTEATSQSIKLSLLDKNALSYFSGKKEAQITYEQALEELNKKQDDIEKEVQESYFNYRKAMVGIESSADRIRFRLRNLEVLKARFNIGEADLSDILTAKMELTEEEAFRLQSLAEYHLSLVRLDKATGYLLNLETS